MTTLLFLASAAVALSLRADDNKILSPAEATKLVGKKCTVEFVVKASKNAMEHRKVMYLDSEEDFRDAKNFAVVITAEAVEKFKKAGVDDSSKHFKGKSIRATGVVSKDEKKKPWIKIDEPEQIKIVKKE